MIPIKSRFSTKLFDKCFRRARKINVGPFIFLITDTRNTASHYSVVVGKKYSKHAVKRNRLRRQIYEIIRITFIPKFKGGNIICLYKGNKNEQNHADLKKYFFQLLRNLSGKYRPPLKKH